MSHAEALIHSAIQNFIDRSFTFMSVGFGCTGGQHRSVYCAQQLSSSISSKFGAAAQVVVVHHNLARLGLLP
jgi:RNase adaptor protein for sRNA GlmZ degradation